MEFIGERISVLASFGVPYKVKPVKFSWSGRACVVRDITYRWKSREGREEIYHFSVTDGKTLYELTFNTSSLLWRLEHIEA